MDVVVVCKVGDQITAALIWLRGGGLNLRAVVEMAQGLAKKHFNKGHS